MTQEDKERIIALLKEGVVEIVFTKLGGTERVMNCTTNSDFMSLLLPPKKVDNDIESDTITVFDTDKQAWRSFKFSNLISWS